MASPAQAPTPASTSALLLRPNSFPYRGRLVVLESGRTSQYDPFAGLAAVAINFPTMPENIELVRSVEYVVTPSWTTPDGIHQYNWTNPLNIPVSFKLHAFDKEYCPQGALSVLQVASLLHSFTLPISSTSGGASVQVTVAQSQPQAVPNGETDSVLNRASSADTPYNTTPESAANIDPPVTLRLELMFVDTQKPGIACIGYLKDVRVRFNGPFLRGPGQSYNLPTSADFEFTFVHVPGYGNNFSLAANPQGQSPVQSQAMAGDVKDKFYNTLDISIISDSSFKGFSN